MFKNLRMRKWRTLLLLLTIHVVVIPVTSWFNNPTHRFLSIVKPLRLLPAFKLHLTKDCRLQRKHRKHQSVPILRRMSTNIENSSPERGSPRTPFQWKDQLLLETFFERVMSRDDDDDDKETWLKVEGVFGLFDGDDDVIVADASRDIVATLLQSLRHDEESGNFNYKYSLAYDNSMRELPVVKIRVHEFNESLSEAELQSTLDQAVETLSPILSPSYSTDLQKPTSHTTEEILEGVVTEEEKVSSIISPFAQGSESSALEDIERVNDIPWKDREMNVESVNLILDRVRPYLVADGGNVEVVEVDPVNQIVKLALQGACSSCSSSTVRNIHTKYSSLLF